MECILCKKETSEKSPRYVEPICLDCDNMLTESDRKRSEFMTQYNLDHAACPNCGDLAHSSTLAGFMYYSDKPDEYKNLNNCVCSHCGGKHKVHDRIPKRK
jgi:hypothetical protein